MFDVKTKEQDTSQGWSIPRAVAEQGGLLRVVQEAEQPTTGRVVGGVHIGQLQHGREQRDTAAWDALWQALDPKLRTRVQETAHELAKAETALSSARAQLADLDQRQPSKAADVPKWAAKRGEVAGMISAYEGLVHGARQAYEQAAQAALTAAQTIVARQAQQAVQAHNEAEREYQRRREAARQYLNEAHEARDTVGRLFTKVNSGDVDIFR